MDWFLYDNGLRHERVKQLLDLLAEYYVDNQNYFKITYYIDKIGTTEANLQRCSYKKVF